MNDKGKFQWHLSMRHNNRDFIYHKIIATDQDTLFGTGLFKVINVLEQQHIIRNRTGWSRDDIYLLDSILFDMVK